MAHRKKTARKKTAKRKTVHTIPGKVKSYRRKETVKAHTRLVAGLEGYYPPGTTTKTMQKVYSLSSFNGLRKGSNVTILSKDEFNGLKGKVSNISTFQTNIDNPDIFINVKWGSGYRLTKRKTASLIF